MTRQLFSQHWHSVAALKPRLIANARVVRHVYRDQVWHVVQDAAGGRFHRLSVDAYAFIAGMDGHATVQQLWDQACASGQANIPAQGEVVELLIQLHAGDLLHADVTPDSASLFQRYQKRKSQTLKQWLMNPMSLKIPLIDPNRFLQRWSSLLNHAFTVWGGLLWLALVLPACVLAAQHWRPLTENLGDQLLSSSNLLVMALVFPLVKLVHELGHGFAVKKWGGSVHEMGLMFLVFAPVPYVDASSASAFPSKYQRAVVGAAGMLAEVFLSALAMYVWVLAEAGVVRAAAFNVMVVGGISTLIVNGNPLLRYDGYYIFSDLIEMPNLAQRGQQFWTWLCDTVLFRATGVEAPDETPAERRWLFCYTPLAWCYRLFVTLSIILFIAGEFFIFGVVLALWGAASLFIVPLWKAGKHILHSPALQRRRSFAIRVTTALVAGLLLILFAVPVPQRTQAEGVVWLPDQAILRAGGNGFFKRWLLPAGSAVKPGDAVLVLDDPLLATELGVQQAKVQEAQARHAAEQFTNPAKAGVLRQQLDHEISVQSRLAGRQQLLLGSAQISGTLAMATPQDMPGRYFKKGEVLGYVLDRQQLIARVVVRQDQIDLVRKKLHGAELRIAEHIAAAAPADVVRELPGGVEELPSSALSLANGGTIPSDPKDPNGVKTLERIFLVDFQLPPGMVPSAFGQKVHVRFSHHFEPLGWQGVRLLRQTFLTRFNV